jgi:hypothetical protein
VRLDGNCQEFLWSIAIIRKFSNGAGDGPEGSRLLRFHESKKITLNFGLQLRELELTVLGTDNFERISLSCHANGLFEGISDGYIHIFQSLSSIDLKGLVIWGVGL